MKIIQEHLLDLFRGSGKCESCRKRVSARDPHHLMARGQSSGGRLDVRCNIVSLCRVCHTKAHGEGNLNRELLIVVAEREGYTPEAVLEVLKRLHSLCKPSRSEIVIAINGLSLDGWELARRELEECGVLEAQA